MKQEAQNSKWFVDSGCSRHMTGDKHLFTSLTYKKGGNVTFGDNSKGKIIGVGTIGDKNSISLENVFLVEGLHYNLLSISQLSDKGYMITFKSNACTINDNLGNTIIEAPRVNNTYTLDLKIHKTKNICLAAISESSWLWHRRLGHASMDLLSNLSKKGLVKGLPDSKFVKDKICDACQLGKQTRSSFKTKSEISTKRPLELLHMDLFGPTQISSLSGKRYAYVIVDDFSRFTWVFFLNHKNETCKTLISFAKQIQNEQELSIVSIRSDRGGEFVNQSFQDFCNENGIRHNFSSPRTPQQNGVAERKNRSLQEMARTMINEHSLPKYLWAEAVSTTCFVINRVTIRRMINKTPYHILKGRKPNIKFFRVFGCKCFILNTKDALG